MILTINAVTTDSATISLGDTTIAFKPLDTKGQQQVLVQIDQLIKQNRVSPRDITQIVVNPGPGSFTSIRVAIAIANALAQSWAVPISLIDTPDKVQRLVKPFYDRPANITQKK